MVITHKILPLLMSFYLLLTVANGQGQDLIENTDITFVADTSGSIGSINFQYVREFIEDIVLEMNISPNNSRVAVILFDSSARLRFNLNRYTDKETLIAAVHNLPYSGGGTNIPEALDLLRTTAQNGSLGIRNNTRQIAIFLTDGEGGDVTQSAAELAATNIFQLFSVGIVNARLDQLNLIASNESDNVYFHPQLTNTSLVVIAESIIKRLKEKFIVMQPRLGSMLGGTLIQIIENTINFDERLNYTCLFDETEEVEGVYFMHSGIKQILCVSPLLRRTGRVNVALSSYDPQVSTQKILLATDTFFSLTVEDSNAVKSEDVLLFPGNKTIIQWSPDSLDASAVTTGYNVDIYLYRLDLLSENYVLLEKIASAIPNTGMYEITLPLVNLPDTFAAGLFGVSLSEQFTSVSTGNTIPDDVLDLIRKASKFGLIYVGGSVASRGICAAWHLTESDDIGETILDRLPPCPPVRDAALKDPDFIEQNFLLSFYHPGASSCFQQVQFTSENLGSGQQCCYSENGTLLVGPEAGGNVDLYAPEQYFWDHQLRDIIPFIFCCKGLFSDCSAYYERRPSDNGDGYVLIPPAEVIGDPHIITLDGFKYTFNGKGEFLLIDHVDRRFTLQGRMINALFSFNQATVFSAVVGKQNDSDAVQFEINQQNNGIDVIVGGKMIDLNGIFQETFNNVTVFNLGNDTFAASFSSGCFIKVKEENGFISVFSVNAPSSFKGLTRGLMGNFNGDITDDLMARNSAEPLPYNSTIEVIHNDFGITWFVNENETLFTYNQQIDQSWVSFYDPNFQPVFTVTANENQRMFCRSNSFCLYDIAVTGSMEIATSTLESSNQYDKIVQLSYPVICEPPCVQGACVANDTCNCVEGYEGDQCTEAVYTDCEVNVCENGGICRKLGSSYTCECTNGYSGVNCEIAKQCNLKEIIGKLIKTITEGTVEITFAADDSAADFCCRLDRGQFVDCTSPWTLTDVAKGNHFITVEAKCPNAGIKIRRIFRFKVE